MLYARETTWATMYMKRFYSPANTTWDPYTIYNVPPTRKYHVGLYKQLVMEICASMILPRGLESARSIIYLND